MKNEAEKDFLGLNNKEIPTKDDDVDSDDD